jgi:hypothetical protein
VTHHPARSVIAARAGFDQVDPPAVPDLMIGRCRDRHCPTEMMGDAQPRALRPRVGKVSAIEPTWFGLNPNATKGRRIEVGGGDRQAGRQPEMPVIFRAGFHYCVIR